MGGSVDGAVGGAHEVAGLEAEEELARVLPEREPRTPGQRGAHVGQRVAVLLRELQPRALHGGRVGEVAAIRGARVIVEQVAGRRGLRARDGLAAREERERVAHRAH